LGFVLTGVVGTIITNHYAAKQKELDRSRSFTDKLNEARVGKIVEVWEQLSLHEAAANRFVEDAAEIDKIQHDTAQLKPPKGDPAARALADRTTQDMKSMVELDDAVRDLSDKNRIWLGEEAYKKIHEYLDETHGLTRDSLVDGQEGPARRSRPNLTEIRDLIFANSP